MRGDDGGCRQPMISGVKRKIGKERCVCYFPSVVSIVELRWHEVSPAMQLGRMNLKIIIEFTISV